MSATENERSIMVYSKVIREYCLQNTDMVFDISKEHKEHFSMIPYKTFCKILTRLEQEGIISRVSRGSYVTAKTEKKKNQTVGDYYTHGDHGVYVGYAYYNQVEVSDHKEPKVVIYTNLLDKKTSETNKYKLINVDIKEFTKYHKSIIHLLELIENRANIIDLNESCWAAQVSLYLLDYLDIFFEEVIVAIPYQFSTICTLDRLLNDIHRKNSCIEIWKSHELPEEPRVIVTKANK